jgi:hypothetical protein
MHVVQFFLKFLLGENIERIEAALPQAIVGFIVRTSSNLWTKARQKRSEENSGARR